MGRHQYHKIMWEYLGTLIYHESVLACSYNEPWRYHCTPEYQRTPCYYRKHRYCDNCNPCHVDSVKLVL